MMNPPPAIVITSSCAPSESPAPLHAGIKTRRSFCVRQLRKSKGAPLAALLPQQQSAGHVPGNARRSRSTSPSSAKRKELTSPSVLKRKYLRQVKLLPLPQLSISKGRKDEVSAAMTPSTFEAELADQENQSPNDPEFVRRASERWRRRTGAVQLQPPLQLLPPGSDYQQPDFQWPSSPSQQPAFQRRVFPRPIHYPQSPFNSVPASPILGASPFRRSSPQYSSLNTAPTESTFMRCSRSYSSFGSSSRSRVCVRVDHSPARSPRLARLLVRAGRSMSPSSRKAQGGTQALPERLALDDTVAEEVKKAAQKERFLANPHESSLTAPFRRLSDKIRRSFRGSKNSSSSNRSSNSSSSSTHKNSISSNSIRSSSSISSSSSSSYCSNDNTPIDSSSFTSSTSCQSFLSTSSGYSSACSSSPSSPAIVPRRLSSPPIPHPAMAATLLAGRIPFQDIFLDEPQIAQRFAIMFPSEPRPEWHRHLRQVINKAGQKIFKKGEPHETTIPENLRHQLKHIYVY